MTLVIAAGNGRPASQLDSLAEAISASGIRVATYNYRTLGASIKTLATRDDTARKVSPREAAPA